MKISAKFKIQQNKIYCLLFKILLSLLITTVIITLFIAIFSPNPSAQAKSIKNNALLAEPKITYAYLPADTILYFAADETYESATILPQTYFVAILGESGDYLNVSYLDITGYVLKSTVEICDYEPVTKYAQLKATPNNDGMNINLRKTADHVNAEIITTVPPQTNLTLYGKISGTALIPPAGNQWYYVKYTDGETSYYGYVYSAHVLAEEATPNVIEKVPEVVPPPTSEVEPQPTQITKPMQIIFIIALCIPAVGVMLLLFRRKPNKSNSKQPRHSNSDF